MKTRNLVVIFALLLMTLAGGLAFLVVERNQLFGSRQFSKDQTEQVQAVMLIDGVEYRTAMKPASSVYDLMNTLKEQRKIDFKGYDYSGLGFFVEEINGVKNDPAGENWIYYVNGQPAPVGVSYYKFKNNDTIEWKYEKKNF